jgi:hypothetical protein
MPLARRRAASGKGGLKMRSRSPVVPALLSTELARTLFMVLVIILAKQAVGSFLSVATELLTWYNLPSPLVSMVFGLLPEEHSFLSDLLLEKKWQGLKVIFFIISQHSCSGWF